jgi:GTP pyrophosphokinase
VSAYQFAKALREKDAKHEAVPPLEEEAIKPMLSPSKRKKKGLPIEISGLQGVLVKISRCCRPLPGEEIVGYVTKGRGVAIHRRDCPNLSDSHTQTEKLIAAKWNPASEETFPIDVEVEAFDRVGVLKDILEKVAEVGTNVSAANVKTKRGSMAIIKLGIDVKNVNHLNQVFAAIRKVSDVYEVARFDIFRKGSML